MALSHSQKYLTLAVSLDEVISNSIRLSHSLRKPRHIDFRHLLPLQCHCTSWMASPTSSKLPPSFYQRLFYHITHLKHSSTESNLLGSVSSPPYNGHHCSAVHIFNILHPSDHFSQEPHSSSSGSRIHAHTVSYFCSSAFRSFPAHASTFVPVPPPVPRFHCGSCHLPSIMVLGDSSLTSSVSPSVMIASNKGLRSLIQSYFQFKLSCHTYSTPHHISAALIHVLYYSILFYSIRTYATSDFLMQSKSSSQITLS